MWKAVAAVCVGASLGALLRWWLGAQLNSHFPSIPPGTLAANLIGGYVVGIAIAFLAYAPGLAADDARGNRHGRVDAQLKYGADIWKDRC